MQGQGRAVARPCADFLPHGSAAGGTASRWKNRESQKKIDPDSGNSATFYMRALLATKKADLETATRGTPIAECPLSRRRALGLVERLPAVASKLRHFASDVDIVIVPH